MEKVFVLGASGFVGRRLVSRLVERGFAVRAGSRSPGSPARGVESARCDLESRRSIESALDGCGAAIFLVHGLNREGDYPAWERAGALRFCRAARDRGVRRVVYLGGLSPAGEASRHLKSRLAVGEILRQAGIGCVELRASLLIGEGGASWKIARDLALRLPRLPLTPFSLARTEPLDVDDAIAAIVASLDPALAAPAIFDLPGPATLTVADFLALIARRAGRHLARFEAPRLTVELAALGARLLCGSDFSLTRELLLGLSHDVVAVDHSGWRALGHSRLVGLEESVDRALAATQVARNGLT